MICNESLTVCQYEIRIRAYCATFSFSNSCTKNCDFNHEFFRTKIEKMVVKQRSILISISVKLKPAK